MQKLSHEVDLFQTLIIRMKKLRYWSVLAQNLDLNLKVMRTKVVQIIKVLKIIVKRQIRKVMINFKLKNI